MPMLVLDASALLAPMLEEPGGEAIVDRIAGAAICSVNVCEVMTRLIDLGGDVWTIRANIAGLDLDIVDFDTSLAMRAAELRASTRSRGLSLGDRACLALAERVGGVALTADSSWAGLDLGIKVEMIR